MEWHTTHVTKYYNIHVCIYVQNIKIHLYNNNGISFFVTLQFFFYFPQVYSVRTVRRLRGPCHVFLLWRVNSQQKNPLYYCYYYPNCARYSPQSCGMDGGRSVFMLFAQSRPPIVVACNTYTHCVILKKI